MLVEVVQEVCGISTAECNQLYEQVAVQLEVKPIVIPKRGTIARGICYAVVEKSRFLADKPGFGMTSLEGFVQIAPLPTDSLTRFRFPAR
jgi:hypothetical protein